MKGDTEMIRRTERAIISIRTHEYDDSDNGGTEMTKGHWNSKWPSRCLIETTTTTTTTMEKKKNVGDFLSFLVVSTDFRKHYWHALRANVLPYTFKWSILSDEATENDYDLTVNRCRHFHSPKQIQIFIAFCRYIFSFSLWRECWFSQLFSSPVNMHKLADCILTGEWDFNAPSNFIT